MHGGSGQKTICLALEMLQDLTSRYVEMPEYKKGCTPLKDQTIIEQIEDLDDCHELPMSSPQQNEPTFYDNEESNFETMETPFLNPLKAMPTEESSNIDGAITTDNTSMSPKPSSAKGNRVAMIRTLSKSKSKASATAAK